MTDEYYDQIDQIVERRWTNNDAEAWGKIFDQAHADSRHAWEIYGVDPDSDLLREPYVRNDGASRIDRITGAVYGGGLPAAQWHTTEDLISQGWTCADIPNLPGMWGAGSVEGYLKFHPTPYALPAAPPVKKDDNLLLWAIFGLFAAAVVALPFMLWIGG